MRRLLLSLFIVNSLYSVALADTAPRLKALPPLNWGLDWITDLTSAGTVTGTDVAFSSLLSCGAIATDANGNFFCSTSAGTGTVTSISQGTNMSFSANPITTTGTISLTASPSVTNLTASGTVTGAVVSATSALQVGSDYIKDITGSGLSIVGGALTASGGSNHNLLSSTHSDSVAASATRGDLIVANSTPAWAAFAVGGSNTVLTANGTDPAWSASPTVTNLTATNTVTGVAVDVSGNLRLSYTTANTYVKTNGGKVLISQATPIPVTDGGTSASTFTTNGVLYGNATSAIQATSQGGTNTVLTANAGAPSFSTSPTVTNLTATATVTGLVISGTSALQVGSDYLSDITGSGLVITGQALSVGAGTGITVNSTNVALTTPVTVANGGTSATTFTANGVLYGNTTSAVQVTSQGGTNTVLTANAGAPAFSNSPTVSNLTATATVTGLVVSGTSALQVGSDYVQDITGSGLSIVGGALTRTALGMIFLPQGAVLDDGSPPTLTLTESSGTGTPRRYVLAFNAATDQIAYWTFVAPTGITASATITYNIYWYANSTTANADAIWAGQISCTTPADADSMVEDAAQALNATDTVATNVDTTEANRLLKSVLTIASSDSIAAGDLCTVRIQRDADDSIGNADNDGLSVDANVVAIEQIIP